MYECPVLESLIGAASIRKWLIQAAIPHWRGAEGAAVIPPGARVWIAISHMRKGMQGLALVVQQHLHRDPHGGDLLVFRRRIGSLVKII